MGSLTAEELKLLVQNEVYTTARGYYTIPAPERDARKPIVLSLAAGQMDVLSMDSGKVRFVFGASPGVHVELPARDAARFADMVLTHLNPPTDG